MTFFKIQFRSNSETDKWFATDIQFNSQRQANAFKANLNRQYGWQKARVIADTKPVREVSL